jgi:acetolactate synthase-1/2/3 large subunit
MDVKKIRVADYISTRCVGAGASHVFLVTGGGAMHLNDAFGRNKDLEPVCFHHEQAAAIAAESYFRLRNKLAVLNVTTGPGGINALNGVYGAYVDSLAMLVISGQVKRETYLRNYPIPMRQLGDQEVDIVSMAQPAVKYATVLQDPFLVGEVMDKAIFLATSGRPGPVWVDVPVDVQGALIDPSQLSHFDCTNLQALAKDTALTPNTVLELNTLGSNDLDKSIRLIIEQLKKAKFPAIMAGSGVRISGMHPEFIKLIETLKIPVVTGWNAHDTLYNDHPCYAGRPGTVGNRTGNFVIQNADFLLVLGCRLNIRQVSYNWKSFASKAWIAMVDVDDAELKKPTLNLDLPVQETLQKYIPAMLQELQDYEAPKAHQAFLKWAKQRLMKYPTVLLEYKKKSNPVNPYVFIEELFTKLNSDDVVVAGNGSACVIGFQAADLKSGQRLYTNSGNASMGYDLPAAIGAAVANDKKRVVCLAGDGSLMMNLQELQTVVGYRLPVKIIILNNDGYHSIRQTQETYFSDSLIGIGSDTGVSLPNFVEIGKAFNIPSKRVSSSRDLSATLEWFLNEEKGAAILEVMLDIDQTFSPKLASRKLPDGTMVSPSLEDMAPFLSREELSENIINP